MRAPEFWADHIERVFLPDVRALRLAVWKRSLSAFADLESEANAVMNEAYERIGNSPYGEDDLGSIAEAAYDAGLEHYETMTGVQQGMLNLLAVWLRHLLEQQIQLIVRRCLYSWVEERRRPAVDPKELEVRLRRAGIDLRTFPSWAVMEELRLVANVAKHADGKSADELRRIRPDLFIAPSLRRDPSILRMPVSQMFGFPMSGDDFYVTEKDLERYFDAAEEFWTDLAKRMR